MKRSENKKLVTYSGGKQPKGVNITLSMVFDRLKSYITKGYHFPMSHVVHGVALMYYILGIYEAIQHILHNNPSG